MADPIAPFYKRHAKTITAVVGAGISWGVLVLTSKTGPITGGEVASGLILVGTALGVYRVPNTPA